MRSLFTRGGSALFIAAMAATPAAAQSVTVCFSGSVSHAEGDFEGAALGTPVAGQYTYDLRMRSSEETSGT
jgi:hypothetical protein